MFIALYQANVLIARNASTYLVLERMLFRIPRWRRASSGRLAHTRVLGAAQALQFTCCNLEEEIPESEDLL